MKKLILSLLGIMCAFAAASAQDGSRGWKLECEAGFTSSFYWSGLTYGGLQTYSDVYYGYSFSEDCYLGMCLSGTDDWELNINMPLTYDTDPYYMAAFGLCAGFFGKLEVSLLGEIYQEDDMYMTGELAYTVSENFPLRLSCYTVFLGEGDRRENGKRYYSTHLAASYDFSFFDERLEVSPIVEYTPWDSPFNDGFESAHWNFFGVNAKWNFMDGLFGVGALAGWNPTFNLPVVQLSLSTTI